ncbi:MAG: primosomal protein N' [Verrucomicrobia bacterium]|nr:primosomal protein N' [Verrucomicrobiota bacterium]
MTPSFSQYAAVMVDGGPTKPLDYGVPKELLVQEGSRVRVLLRGKERTGTVVSLKQEPPSFAGTLPILSLLEEQLPSDLTKLAKWIASYYACTETAVMRSFLPSNIRQQKGRKEQLKVSLAKPHECIRQSTIELQEKAPAQARLLEVLLQAKHPPLLTELLELANSCRSAVAALEKKGLLQMRSVVIDRSLLADADYFPTRPKSLNSFQQNALDQIQSSLGEGRFVTYLLFGVTGSGKTEVYLQAISKALALGKKVIVLVPEIALTSQTLERFRSRFQEKIALLHYRLSDGERADAWRKIKEGEVDIVIGARSAIFSPLPNLGLIVVDEEHEPSYKQSDSAPLYHARDVAVMRGKLNNATVVLGSATPSLESFANAKGGKYRLLELPTRAQEAELPSLEIIDMRREKHPLFCDLLLSEIAKRVIIGEQSLLFLNRRGYHTSLVCSLCNEAVQCLHCSTSLTFHLKTNCCCCHLCGFSIPPPRLCPHCKTGEPMKFCGVGTEQIERALHAIFPNIRSLRADGDTTRHKGSHEELLHSFRSGKADVLIGTQMIAKGLHFPQVTLVGVLNIDASLHIPDFRASERVFQLITQVAGRAGRGQLKGRVLIQTRLPEHPIICAAVQQDYQRFFNQEIASRQLFQFPPTSHLIKVTFSGDEEQEVQAAAKKAFSTLALSPPHAALPPLPSGYAKVKGKHRFQFFLRGPSVSHMNEQLRSMSTQKGIRCTIDVDPTSTFF